MVKMTTYLFSAPEHSHLVPYLAALHAACITHDRMIGTFLPPLHHEKLLTWWKDRIAEVNAGKRLILLLLAEKQPGLRPQGTDLMGVAMLAMPESETGPFRGYVEKVLVSKKCRGQGAATRLMGVLEGEALKREKTLLMLDVESDTVGEGVFRRLGYHEIGRVPNYALNPVQQLRSQTFFFKNLST